MVSCPYKLNKPSFVIETHKEKGWNVLKVRNLNTQEDLDKAWVDLESDPGIPNSWRYSHRSLLTPRLTIQLMSEYYPEIISKVVA